MTLAVAVPPNQDQPLEQSDGCQYPLEPCTCERPDKTLEQKILQRIKELENMWFTGPNVMKDIEYRDVKLDELRKLLSSK